MGFTGYLLPWNQRAFWATTVGTQIAGSVPFVGDFILKSLRGGPDLSALTLQRFFSGHIWMLPTILAGLIGVHLFLIIKHGEFAFPDQGRLTSPLSGTKRESGSAYHEPFDFGYILRSGRQFMNDETKNKINERYERELNKGERFWPDSIFKDLIVSLGIFILLIVLATFIRSGPRTQSRPKRYILRSPP